MVRYMSRCFRMLTYVDFERVRTTETTMLGERRRAIALKYVVYRRPSPSLHRPSFTVRGLISVAKYASW